MIQVLYLNVDINDTSIRVFEDGSKFCNLCYLIYLSWG